ncbi:hypothetical protein SAMN04487846_1594 [Microbacterium sp. cf046]|uniref:hypothetical protein n=1 Tax=Microbacterium sp. cf046 TaxID=1761803 RepID=UPI0008F07F02|nr:hypothetical protein [Microbacterium sp. cf046]SFS02646.1 hypothetical protein SAMN04487846_1594 [Microbacterium sp. cf046]
MMARVVTPAFAGMPRLNLMPRVEVERREREALTRKWVWGVLGAVLITLLIIGAAFAFKWLADQRLVAEQAKTNDLLLELSALSEVSRSLAAEEELTQFRSEAMASDFAWAPVIAKVASVLPADVILTGFDLASGGAGQTDEPTSEIGLEGTFALDSPNPIDIVGVVRALRAVDGVLYADGQAVTASTVTEGRFAYQLTVSFDQSIYSSAYVAEEEAD